MECDDLFIQSKLPKPLSKKDLTQYFKKYKSGDMKARDIIIMHNIKLVFNEIYRKFSTIPDKQELVSIGLIGLIKGVDTFDISKGYQFSGYAIKCIDNEILMSIRKESKNKNNDSLDKTISSKDDMEVKLKDVLVDENSNMTFDYEEKEMILTILKAINDLNERNKEIVILYYGLYGNERHTQEELSKIYGICRSGISKVISTSLKKIERVLKNEGYLDNISNSNLIKGLIIKASSDEKNVNTVKSINSKKH